MSAQSCGCDPEAGWTCQMHMDQQRAEWGANRLTIDIEDGNPDYITIMDCPNPHRKMVAIMSFDRVLDSYMIKKCSGQLTEQSGKALAASWQAATGLELR